MTLYWKFRARPTLAFLAGCGILVAQAAWSQTSLPVYLDSLQSGFQDWSWATHSLNNSAPVHSGTRSISVTSAYWQGLSFWHSDLNTGPYASFSFWIHGGTAGGQRLQIYTECGTNPPVTYVFPSALPANSWQQYTIPLISLGIENKLNFNRLTFQLRANGTSGTYYVDDIQFEPAPVPNTVRVSLNATQVLNSAEERHFGVNLAIWDGNFDPPQHTTTISLLQEMGTTVVRMPGGSLSDEYHFVSNTSWTNTWAWQTSFPDFMRVFTNLSVQGCVTVNYGSGTPQEAAAWVGYANGDPSLYGTTADIPLGTDSAGRDWKTAGYWARLRALTPAQNVDNQYDFLALGRSTPFRIKYWEIGNECYGTWERDTNALAHHAYTYATRATNYIGLMKAVDPSIQIGVVAVPGESASDNGYTDHPAINLRTGQTRYGWTPVVLSTLKAAGVIPDFLIHHVYPQWTNPDSPSSSPDDDTTLLQSTSNWRSDAADLRQQIADYFGPLGTNIQLVCTENNSDAGAQGRQSTSLVNGLYYADSLAQLLRTEFRGFMWWDLRNGTDTGGYFGAELYGWRSYGDLGMVNGPSTRHPSFYAAKLLQNYARPGDKILEATSDYPFLAAHAARHKNGSVALLLINKSQQAHLETQINLQGFEPASVATVRSYGIPNDEAARTNAPLAAQGLTSGVVSNAALSFSVIAPKLSISVINLVPPPPVIRAFAAGHQQVILELQGQTDVPYVLQASADFKSWVSVSTNTVSGSSVLVTNQATSAQPQFWRAAWLP